MQLSAVILMVNGAMRILEISFHRFGLGAPKKTAKESNADNLEGQVILLNFRPNPRISSTQASR